MKAVKIISIILIVILIVGLVVGLVFFINNGQNNFYIEYGGQQVTYELSNVDLEEGSYSVFYVKNVFGDVINGVMPDKYEVTVSLNTKNLKNVEYTVGNDLHHLHDLKDVSAPFVITKSQGYFTLYVPEELTLRSMLEKIYPSGNIILSEDLDLTAVDSFVLNVKSITENRTITVSFH